MSMRMEDATSGASQYKKIEAEPVIVKQSQDENVDPLAGVKTAPVTFLPKNKIAKFFANISDAAQQTMRKFAPAAAACMLGVVLLTSGCAGIRGGGIQGAPIDQSPAITAPINGAIQEIREIPAADARAVINLQAAQIDAIDGGTPGVGMVPGNGDADKIHGYHYKKHRSQRWEVSDLGKDGRFALRMVAPQSGHVSDGGNGGFTMAHHYADIGTVELSFKGPNGGTLKLYNESGTEAVDGKILKPFAGQLSQTIGAVVELKPGVNQLWFSPFPEARNDLDCHTKTTRTSHGRRVLPHGAHSFRVSGEPAIRMIEIVWDGT